MSDEFLRVATKEINEELIHIEDLVKQCTSDDDVFNLSDKIEGHFHKIKGLAPMMGKTRIGKIGEQIDSLLKNTIDGKKAEGIRIVLIDVVDFMQSDMNDEKFDYEALENNLAKLCSKI